MWVSWLPLRCAIMGRRSAPCLLPVIHGPLVVCGPAPSLGRPAQEWQHLIAAGIRRPPPPQRVHCTELNSSKTEQREQYSGESEIV